MFLTTPPPAPAPTCYYAEPIDFVKGPSPEAYRVARKLADCGITVYRPATTWAGGQHNPALVEKINRDMLYRSDVMIADLRGNPRSIGVPMEVEAAATRRIPVVAIVDHDAPRSVALQACERVVFTNTNSEAVALGCDLATIRHRERAADPDHLLKVVLADGQTAAPTRGYPDDAGIDLITSESTVIEPGTFGDVPTTITGVQLPPWSWGLITGRSSTLRKRGLLVHSGVIDAGWRGPLFAGAFNLTAEPVKVEAGDRIAQLVVLDNATARVSIAAVGRLDPHARGLNGFGSSGA